jgi:hypothetical protein
MLAPGPCARGGTVTNPVRWPKRRSYPARAEASCDGSCAKAARLSQRSGLAEATGS